MGSIPVGVTNSGGIAQLGEHLPYKQRVTGSSPVVPTKLLSSLMLSNKKTTVMPSLFYCVAFASLSIAIVAVFKRFSDASLVGLALFVRLSLLSVVNASR